MQHFLKLGKQPNTRIHRSFELARETDYKVSSINVKLVRQTHVAKIYFNEDMNKTTMAPSLRNSQAKMTDVLIYIRAVHPF